MTATHATGAFAMRSELAQNWWAIALRGVLGILFGLIALFEPGATMLSLALVFAVYTFVDGILAMTAAVRAVGQQERWGYLMFEGIVDIVAAAIAVLWPGITVVAFVFLVAAWAIVTGALMLAAAFRLDAKDGRWWLVSITYPTWVERCSVIVSCTARTRRDSGHACTPALSSRVCRVQDPSRLHELTLVPNWALTSTLSRG